MEKVFVKLSNNEDTYLKLVEYMKETERDYDIPIRMRVNIEEYAKKIVEYAVTVAVMENDKIIAMANFYCNDIVTKICYATNVSITKKAQEKGYHIFDFAYAIMRIAQKAGMKKFCAETTDRRVFILHRRLGFVEIKREEINGIIHYYDCIEDIDAWLKKYSGQQITILNL